MDGLAAVAIGYAAAGPGFGLGLFCMRPRRAVPAPQRWTLLTLALTMPPLVTLSVGWCVLMLAGATGAGEPPMSAASMPEWGPLLWASNAITFNFGLYWGDRIRQAGVCCSAAIGAPLHRRMDR